VRIGALVEQQAGDRVAIVVDGVHQRRDAFRGRAVDVRAALQQQPCAFKASGSGGVQQRRKPPCGAVLRARLGSDLVAPVVDRRARIHIGLLADQEIHHLDAARGNRPHQRGLAAVLFTLVYVGASLHQHLRQWQRSDARRDHQRRLFIVVALVRIGAGLEQQAHEPLVADGHGLAQRRCAQRIAGIGIRAASQQRLGHFMVYAMHRPQQRRGAIRMHRIDVRARADGLEGGGMLAGLHQVGKFHGSGGQRRQGRQQKERETSDTHAADVTAGKERVRCRCGWLPARRRRSPTGRR
jgi:hypothetical protein